MPQLDPEHVVITEPVAGSDHPVHLMYVEVWDGLYGHHRELTEITNLPKGLRSQLDDLLPTALRAAREVVTDDGATHK